MGSPSREGTSGLKAQRGELELKLGLSTREDFGPRGSLAIPGFGWQSVGRLGSVAGIEWGEAKEGGLDICQQGAQAPTNRHLAPDAKSVKA